MSEGNVSVTIAADVSKFKEAMRKVTSADGRAPHFDHVHYPGQYPYPAIPYRAHLPNEDPFIRAMQAVVDSFERFSVIGQQFAAALATPRRRRRLRGYHPETPARSAMHAAYRGKRRGWK